MNKEMQINKIDIYRIGEEGQNKYEIFKSHYLGNKLTSSVYLGRCMNKDNKTVAIKQINLGIEITNEINILKELNNLNHKNIVKYYDIIEDLSNVYISMEYCEGGDLGVILIKPLKINYIKCYFSQIIHALNFLHDNKIIHRDIKPSNILLTNNRKTIKLCDFSYSKKLGKDIKRVNTVCGSPLYMAPELLNCKNYDNAIDIWAMGIVLFEMIFGYHPCKECKDMHELTTFVTENKIKIPDKKDINNSINDICICLLKKLLHKNGTKRITLNQLIHDKWIHTYNNDDFINLYYEKNDAIIEDPYDNSNELIFEMDDIDEKI